MKLLSSLCVLLWGVHGFADSSPDLDDKTLDLGFSLVLSVPASPTQPPAVDTTTDDGSGEGSGEEFEIHTVSPTPLLDDVYDVVDRRDVKFKVVEVKVPRRMSEPRPRIDEVELEEIRLWLYDLYSETTGFLNVSDISPSAISVQYDVKTLSEEGKLPAADGSNENSIVAEIMGVHEKIAEGEDFPDLGDDVSVDRDKTEDINDDAIKDIEEEIVDQTCSDSCPSDRATVCTVVDGVAICGDKCELFNDVTGCEGDGLLATGTCEYDRNANPYCDCGSSGLLKNFYDEWGNQCLNSSFIVGIAAGGMVLIIAAFTISLCTLNRKRKTLETKSKYEILDNSEGKGQAYRESLNGKASVSSYPPPSVHSKRSVGSDRVSVHSKRNASTTSEQEGSDEEGNAYSIYTPEAYQQQMALGYDNKSYRLDDDVKDPAVAALISDYADFVPRLDHIDPQVDFKIARPVFMTGKY